MKLFGYLLCCGVSLLPAMVRADAPAKPNILLEKPANHGLIPEPKSGA